MTSIILSEYKESFNMLKWTTQYNDDLPAKTSVYMDIELLLSIFLGSTTPYLLIGHMGHEQSWNNIVVT